LAAVALRARQQAGQRHSMARVPSKAVTRLKRQPKLALTNVWAVFVCGAGRRQPTHDGRSNIPKPLS
jgi:hypothetical protein